MACLNCRHYQPREVNFLDDKISKPQTCLIGNNEKIPYNFELSKIDCFEYTNTAKTLISISKKLDEMLNLLDNKENGRIIK